MQGGIDGRERDGGPDPVIGGSGLVHGSGGRCNGLLFAKAGGVEGGIDGIGLDLGGLDGHQIAQGAHIICRKRLADPIEGVGTGLAGRGEQGHPHGTRRGAVDGHISHLCTG